jgi:hypothetical protein
MFKMDYREAKACLDEYRSSLSAICRLIDTKIAKGEFHDAIVERNDRLIADLKQLRREALILSTLIWEGMTARAEQMMDFPDELADLLVAQNELKAAINAATELQADYLRKTDAEKAKQEAAKGPSSSELVIAAFRRGQALRHAEEREARNQRRSASASTSDEPI